MTSKIILFSAITITLAASLGCGSKQLLFGTDADSKIATQLATLQYPKDIPISGDLDIIIIRERASIRVINLTARSYENVQLWINRQYVTIAKNIQIGTAGRGELASTLGGVIQGATAAEFQPNRLELRNFINKHREPYPVGGILNPDKTRKIVLTELYDTESGKRYRLTTQ